jgi:hypothetical protein
MKKNTFKGRPKAQKIPFFVVKEIQRFFDEYPSIRAGAIAMGVSSTSAWNWYHGFYRPSQKYIKIMEKLSRGRISLSLINETTASLVNGVESLKDFIKNNHLQSKAEILGISVDEYYTSYVHPRVQAIIDSNTIKETDLPLLHSFFDSTLEYWVQVMNEFNLKF